MDLVDPKRDFLLTLNESAQSQIAACIPSPPPPHPPLPPLKNLGGLRGERRPRSLHNRCYCYYFFLQEGGVGGCPNPPYLGKNRNTAVGRKNFSESTCYRNEDFRETRQCDVLQVCAQEHQNTFEAPVLFWDEQSDIFGKTSVSSLRRPRTDISRDFV